MTTANKENKYQILYHILWLLAAILSVAQIYFLAEPMSLLYSAIISLLLLILVLFLIIVYPNQYSQALNQNNILIFLIIYIMVLTWLGLNKTIPEYKEIVSFQKDRSDLVYRMGLNENGALYKLAYLYLKAPESVNKVESNVNHKGAIIFGQFLEGKIADGKGPSYYDDMYELAEVSFTSTGHDFAKIWYERAEKYGKDGSIKRFNERLKAFAN